MHGCMLSTTVLASWPGSARRTRRERKENDVRTKDKRAWLSAFTLSQKHNIPHKMMRPSSHVRTVGVLSRGQPAATIGSLKSANQRGARGGGNLRLFTPMTIQQVVIALILVTASFYAGFFAGMNFRKKQYTSPPFGAALIEEVVQQRVAEELIKRRCAVAEEQLLGGNQQGHQQIKVSNKQKATRMFSSGVSGLAVGMVRSSKGDFLSHFDYGLPKSNQLEVEASEVIILYSHSDSMPSSLDLENSARESENNIPLLTALQATENCELLNVVVTGRQNGALNRCIALMDGPESYHVQRWMRIGTSSASPFMSLNKKYPLRHVSRGIQPNGVAVFNPPTTGHIEENWNFLRTYLKTVDDVLKRLRPITKRIVKNNTIIVMVCNMGQSSLLVNFACAARAKGLDISSVLVFCTDEETLSIAHGLGLAAFYDEHNFASIPSSEAQVYGDKAFTAMMYAKVITVQLINKLGYDCLFQDVDVVWYKDPLLLFHNKSSSLAEFDILFQDDGARSLRYQPFCSNSGFYYVRYNSRTEYLLTSLLYAADLVKATRSHQQALSALLAEHASLYGLRVKTLDGEDLPGGYHFHKKKDFMHGLLNGTKNPWIFHMSWTKNKENKLLFMRQMGLWHVKEQCLDHKALDHVSTNSSLSNTEMANNIVSACCSDFALISCHYRDKPSIVNCNESPSIDKNGKVFWEKDYPVAA